jgi:hypothetical protein
LQHRDYDACDGNRDADDCRNRSTPIPKRRLMLTLLALGPF